MWKYPYDVSELRNMEKNIRQKVHLSIVDSGME